MPCSKTTFGVQTPRPSLIRTPQTQPRAVAMMVHLAFAASLLATVGLAPVAHAQVDSASSAQGQVQEDNVHHFDIPAGPLSTVLTQFSTEAGIFLVGATDLAQGKSSPGVQGRFSVQAALNQLLAGTGLQAQPNSQGQYVLQEVGGATTLPPVRVSANAEQAGTAEEGYVVSKPSTIGPWEGRSLQDTPYSMSVVSEELIENLQATSFDEVAKVNPVIQFHWPQAQSDGAYMFLRGFESRTVARNGLSRQSNNHSNGIVMEEVERVEVLTGLSGFLYGGGNVGGIVNFVTKRPTEKSLNST